MGLIQEQKWNWNALKGMNLTATNIYLGMQDNDLLPCFCD